MAYRMQSSGPDLIDFGKESKETLEMYGVEPGKSSYANNCLLARRLVERGTRFVQLYHTEWDHHDDIGKPLDTACREIDQPTTALIRDLKQRGLLDSTLVIWGGEFGRSPTINGSSSVDRGRAGRDHNPYGFSIWMAGGGVKGGKAIGSTDEIGLRAVDDRVHLNDLHATVLGLLGLDHLKLTYHYLGRDFRLTDVRGKTDMIAKLRNA
jgi:uncharacterized protein (DUF1501 family)